MLYHLQDLRMVFGDRRVLDVASLNLEPGRVYGLLGPNGAGKTTLLQILAFLQPPTSGRVTYNDRPVRFEEAALRSLRREVVLVHQNPVLFSTSVRKNVEFGLKSAESREGNGSVGPPKPLDLVGMRGFASARAQTLSGGETQRVALARALACSPRVLLLDEPTASVDTENRIAIENIIREVNRDRSLSVIFTTHDTIQSARLAHDVVFLFEGRPASSIYENIFPARVETDDQDRLICRILGRLDIQVEGLPLGALKVSLDPWKIRLGSTNGPGNDGWLDGRIMQITDEGGHVRALIDVGLPLAVLLDRSAYQSSGFLAGGRVRVHCPPEAVEIV